MSNPSGDDQHPDDPNRGDTGGGAPVEGGLPEVEAATILAQPEGGEDRLSEETPPAADAASGAAQGRQVGVEDSGGGGIKVQGGDKLRVNEEHGNTKVSKQTFRAATIANDGNRTHIARALGLDKSSVSRRIAADPELNALYGDHKADLPAEAPAELKALGRRRSDLEAIPGIELVDAVAEMDRENYRAALEKYGVSKGTLEKLKALDGLAADGGRLLAVSLQMTHQNYVGQLHKLAEVADDIKKRLTDELGAEDYSYLAKVYVECVKEAGKGYGLMMTGTEAMIRMMVSARGQGGGEPKAQAGWGPMKKVTRPQG